MGYHHQHHGHPILPRHNTDSIAGAVKQSAYNSWSKVTGRVRAHAREAYYRDLCLFQRILCVHAFLLAKVWYTAQISPAPDACVRQLNLAISWYLWQGATFQVPLSTLQRRKEHGGWDLINIAAKSRAPLIDRLRTQGLKKERLRLRGYRNGKY
jgi:hypothetical protein